MAHQPPAPLTLPDGTPLHVAADQFRDGEGLALPPVFSFAAVIGGASKTYYHDRFDEAMRHSRENALAMRRDAYLMSLLQERKMAVSSLPWYLETPDPKDKRQEQVRGAMTQVLRGTRGFRRMILSWLEAIWYGRYGNQFSWKWGQVDGRRVLNVDRWAPLNGDKIGYHWDGTPYVLVNAARAANLPGVVLTNTTRARALSLVGGWRDRFVIHQHDIDDADYFESEAGAGRHGVGIRSRIYWLDFLKREYLDWVVTYLERVGLGTTLWKYDASSPEQKAAAEEAARDNSRRVNITVPVWPDRSGGFSGGLERIEAPMGGVEALRTMIEAMDQYIERFVVGQSGSSRSQSSGLGNEAASEFMASTKDAIRDHDAHLLAETITGSEEEPGLLSLIQRYSFPETTPDRPDGFPVLFRFGLEKSLNNQRIQSIQSIVQLGLPVRKDDIYNAAGLSRPEEHDDVLEPPQQGAGGNPLAAMMGGGGPPGEGDVPPDDPDAPSGEDAPASEEDVDSFLNELFGGDDEGGEPEEDTASEEDVDGFLAELLGGGEEDDQPQQMARRGRGVEQYGWEMTRELGDGRKRWKGTEEHKGQYRTQRIKPGTRVKASGDNRRSIGEHIDTLLESPEQFTPEHRADLRSKLLTLTRDQFAALRAQFGIRKKGRRKEDEINTLIEGVEGKKKPKEQEDKMEAHRKALLEKAGAYDAARTASVRPVKIPGMEWMDEVGDSEEAKTEEERMTGETLEQAMARKVGYQVENGLVKIASDSGGWEARVTSHTGKPYVFRATDKDDLISQVFHHLYPGLALVPSREERKGPDPRAGRNREGLGGAKVPEKPMTQKDGESVDALMEQVNEAAERAAHRYFTVDGGGRFNDMGRRRTQRQRDKRPHKTPASFEPYAQFGGLQKRMQDDIRSGSMTPEKLDFYKQKFERLQRGDYSDPLTPEQEKERSDRAMAAERMHSHREAEKAERRKARVEGKERNTQRIEKQGYNIRKINNDLYDGQSKLPDGRVVSYEVVDDSGIPLNESTAADANWNYRYVVTNTDGSRIEGIPHKSQTRMRDSGELKKLLSKQRQQPEAGPQEGDTNAEGLGGAKVKKQPWVMTQSEYKSAVQNASPSDVSFSTSEEVDWGSHSRGRGRRRGGKGGLMRGAMTDAPTGKKKYVDIFGSLPPDQGTEANGLGGAGKVSYLKARAAGFDHEVAMIQGYAAEDASVNPHKLAVESALAAGKPVPPEVLADYPDLASQYGPQEGDTNAEE